MELNAMKEREAICDVCHKMWQRGIVAANDGNVSVKLEDGTFLCTPSGVSKAAMTPEILVHLAADGSVISAAEGYKPSSEMKMHFRCYAEREDVKAVVHAHPPIATSYASMGRALDGYQAMEFIVNLGAVPIAPYAQPSTDEVPDSIAPFLQDFTGTSRSTDGGRQSDQSLLQDGIAGDVCKNFAVYPSAGGCTGHAAG